MGVGYQFACASLVAAFSVAMLITTNIFVEHRSAKRPVNPYCAAYSTVASEKPSQSRSKLLGCI
jgi:hypothetical protein